MGEFGFRFDEFANGVTGGFVNWVHRRMGRLDEGGQAWLESQSEYSKAENVGVVAGAIVPLPGPGKFSAAKALLRAWGKGTFPTIAKSVRYHFAKHGAEVGAKDVWQYMRKAEAFGHNLRRAQTSDIGGGLTRYTKNGYYIIKDAGGNILSYGRAR